MAMQPTGLGKGLDALIRETSGNRGSTGTQTLLLKDIIPNPNQPRRSFDEEALDELAASIRSQGLLQPILVRPFANQPGKYEIVAGERRWRACKRAGLIEAPVLIRSFSEQDMRASALIENLQREDLNPLEEALALHGLKEEFGLSQDELAHKIGKSRSAVANSLRLLSLPEYVQNSLVDGRLSAGQARAVLSVSDRDAQLELHDLILAQNLSVREAEGLASLWKESGSFLPSAVESTGKANDGIPAQDFQDDLATSPGASSKKEGKAKPQSARLMEAQHRIGSIFKTPVKVTGKEEKGKISFTFNSREELEALLERLSGTALTGNRHPALGNSDHDALESSNSKQLKNAGHKKLSGKRQSALSGTQNKALSGKSQHTNNPSDDRGE